MRENNPFLHELITEECREPEQVFIMRKMLADGVQPPDIKIYVASCHLSEPYRLRKVW